MFKLQERFLHPHSQDEDIWHTRQTSTDEAFLEEEKMVLEEIFSDDYEYRIVGEEE